MDSRSVRLRFYTLRILAPLAFFSLQLSLSQPQQPQKINIAVLDFDARGGISKEEAITLSDVFNSQLVQTEEFTVVDRNRTKAILAEQGFQQSEACSQVECVVEAGKILKVQKMFFGAIGKVGRVFNVTISMVDVESAKIQLTESQNYAGNVEDLLYETVPTMAATLASKLAGKPIKPKTVSSGSSWYWYVGGAVLVGGGAAVFLFKPKGITTVADENLPGPPKLP